MVDFLVGWVMQFQAAYVWIGIVSFVTFLIGLLTMPFVIIRLPEDYFVFRKTNHQKFIGMGGLRLLFLGFKNLLGALLLCLGVLMLFLPGPGLLVMAIGLVMADIPGKRPMIGRMLRIESLRAAINGFRDRRGRPPLKFED